MFPTVLTYSDWFMGHSAPREMMQPATLLTGFSDGLSRHDWLTPRPGLNQSGAACGFSSRYWTDFVLYIKSAKNGTLGSRDAQDATINRPA